MTDTLLVRELTILTAVAGETTKLRGKHRLAFTALALDAFVREQPEAKVPLMLSHGVTEAEYCGYVNRWAMTEDGHGLLATAHQTRNTPVALGDPVSLGIDHQSRIQEDTGTKLITSFTVRELSLGLKSGAAMPSARVLSVGMWHAIPADRPEGSDDLAARRDERGLSAWRAAGLEVGYSVGNFGGSQPRQIT